MPDFSHLSLKNAQEAKVFRAATAAASHRVSICRDSIRLKACALRSSCLYCGELIFEWPLNGYTCTCVCVWYHYGYGYNHAVYLIQMMWLIMRYERLSL